MPVLIAPPAEDEYAEFHAGYMAAVAGEPDAVAVLERQRAVIDAMHRLTPEQAGHRYAEGKWSVRAIIGHLSDSERVLSYRLLRIARGDRTPLPGFDENAFAAASNADARPLSDLVDELAVVRAATLSLVRSLDDESLVRRGIVREWEMTPRAIAFVIAGHLQHHLRVMRERYGLTV